MAVLEVRDLGFDRGNRTILEGLSFRTDAGERPVLLGGNGSGKTTLARLLNGTELPTRGNVLVLGQDTRDTEGRQQARRTIGLLFQDPDNQFVSTTAEREVAFGLENLGRPTSEIRSAVDAVLDDFGLESLRHTPPHEMSGGEKARLALACIWVMKPRLIVLDETEHLLDHPGRDRLLASIRALPSETAVLRITTDVEVVTECERLLVLHAGRLVADGAPDEVLARLDPETIERTGVPLLWRISSRLVQSGRLDRPTSSWPLLEASLGKRVSRVPAVSNRLRSAHPEDDRDPKPQPPRDDEPLLALEHVTAQYQSFRSQEKPALEDVSLAVRPGDRVGVLGASGAGKSTLFRVLAGLLVPVAGKIHRPHAERSQPSLVFQFPERQLFAETVREDVAYGLRESGVPQAELDARVQDALLRVGLTASEFGPRPPFRLSAGEMRRVALAGALAQERRILLLDEPTLGLDADGLRRLRIILDDLHKRGVAYWLASHAADFVAATCDRVFVLRDGNLVFEGTTTSFWADPDRIEPLGIGLPSTSLLAARLQALGADFQSRQPVEAELEEALAGLVPPAS